MKVLHVVQRYAPAIGGSELVFQQLSERLAARGYQVTVWTTNAREIEYFWDRRAAAFPPGWEVVNGIPVWRVAVHHLGPGDQGYLRLRWLALGLARLPGTLPVLRGLASLTPWLPALAARALQEREPFDLVHAGCVPYDALLLWAERLARRLGVPFLVTPFVHFGRPEDRLLRRHYTLPHQIDLLRRADAVFVQTAYEGEALAALGVPRRAIRRGGAGIEPGALAGGDGAGFRARHGLTGPLVVFLGAALPEKGALDLLAATRLLRQRGCPLTLVLAGKRTAAFDQALAALPPAERECCRVLGPLSEAEKRDLLAAGDLLALPSQTESFGIVYCEAWDAGLPVVAAAVGATSEVVEDRITGRLVPFGDIPALAGVLAELLTDRAQARRLAATGRVRARTRHTWEAVVDRVEAVYREVA
ncbi:MAG: glycosyltransferase family 4 protein [Chloroflexi bacterium]|nr:glycosyltransferase family 4 protein [Chloroflexota bacterium]GIW10321.1 MAG: glycosyl transferase family 1 [Dehalococcoidia bacterium]